MKVLKTLILVIAVSASSFASSFAYRGFSKAEGVLVQQQKDEVAWKDLPEAVQKSIKEKQSEAEFVNAYKIPAADGKSVNYEITLKSDDGQKTMVVDADGNAVGMKSKKVE